MTVVRRIFSPIVVLVGYVVGYYGLQYLTAGSLSVLNASTPTLEDLVFLVVGVLAWACYAWLALGTVLMALSAIPGAFGAACGSVAERVTPAAYRRVAKIALGISIAAGPVFGAMPAQAAPVDNTPAAAAAQQLPNLDRPTSADTGSLSSAAAQLPNLDRPSTSDVSQGLPSPDRPISGQVSTNQSDADDSSNRARGADTEQAQHVVKRGDTLWDIAKSRLPEGASAAQINHEWQRWYDANQQVIGEDPDLILPGQVLEAPPKN